MALTRNSKETVARSARSANLVARRRARAAPRLRCAARRARGRDRGGPPARERALDDGEQAQPHARLVRAAWERMVALERADRLARVGAHADHEVSRAIGAHLHRNAHRVAVIGSREHRNTHEASAMACIVEQVGDAITFRQNFSTPPLTGTHLGATAAPRECEGGVNRGLPRSRTQHD